MSKKTLNLDDLLDLIDREEKKQKGIIVKDVPDVNKTIERSVDKSINKYAYRFIERFGLKQGEIRYPNYLIYYHFRIWCSKSKYTNKIGLTEFFRTFNKYFQQVRTGRQRYYLLDDTLPNDEETVKLAKTYHKHRGIRRSSSDEKE